MAAPPGVLGPTILRALFNQEGPQFYRAAYVHNAPFAQASSTHYQTKLTPQQEVQFRQWVAKNRVPFNPNAVLTDYDMRGYWKANQAHLWHGTAGVTHFPDLYKTPYDTTFSGESMYAKPRTPFVWRGNTLVDERDGQVIFRA